MPAKSNLEGVKQGIYNGKRDAYFSLCRDEIIELIPQGNYRVLDIGCGDGHTGEMLKKSGKAREVIGIEINAQAAQKASQKLDKVINEDIEKIEFPFKEGYFDYILCGDVLEHLLDPWNTLRMLGEYLSPNGFLIASIPNVRHYTVLRSLLFKNEWSYVEEGILDKGHLRFFTYTSILKLFNDSGFQIFKIFNKFQSYFRNSWKVKLFNLFTFNRFSDIFTYQYIIVASLQTKGSEGLP